MNLLSENCRKLKQIENQESIYENNWFGSIYRFGLVGLVCLFVDIGHMPVRMENIELSTCSSCHLKQ